MSARNNIVSLINIHRHPIDTNIGHHLTISSDNEFVSKDTVLSLSLALGIGANALAKVCSEAEAAAGEAPAYREALLGRLHYALDLALADIAAYRHEQALRALR